MIHVAFCMLPEPGHILPSMRVARTMQMSGYKVSYLCPPMMCDYFRRMGFECHAIFGDILRESTPESLLERTSMPSWYRVLHSMAAGEGFGEMLESELQAVAFDALICDGSIVHQWGPIIVRTLRKPVVALSVLLPDGEADQQIGIPEVVLCPQEFEVPSSRSSPTLNRNHLYYAEPSISTEGPYRGVDLADTITNKPLIYCSFGTQTYRYAGVGEVFQRTIEACIGLPYQLVISCNDRAALDWSKSLPSHVTAKPMVPQLAVLEKASLFISHGGLGGLKESIVHKVPILVIPFDMDQPRNAERIAYHQLGTMCSPSDCSSRSIRELVIQVLRSPDIRVRLDRMSETFRRVEDEAPAAKILSNYILNF